MEYVVRAVLAVNCPPRQLQLSRLAFSQPPQWSQREEETLPQEMCR